MAAEVNAKDVKALREMTGAGFMDCKKALAESGGDTEKAVELLRKKGMAAADKRSGKDATEGVIETYVHHDHKKACLVELSCETDFVARTDEFRAFARDLALHVVANRPQFLSSDEIPEDRLAKERAIFEAQAKESGKPDNIAAKIAEGRLNKFFEDVCMLNQKFVKDDSRSVGELVKELAGKLGENIQIRRFALFEVGDSVAA